jgi:hypothetical protein
MKPLVIIITAIVIIAVAGGVYVSLKKAPTPTLPPSSFTPECDSLAENDRAVCILKLAALKNDTIYCNFLTDTPFFEQCSAALWNNDDCQYAQLIHNEASCYTDVAFEQKNISTCNGAIGFSAIGQCRKAVIEFGRTNNDVSVCADDTSCLIQVVNKKEDASMCAGLHHADESTLCNKAVLSNENLFKLVVSEIKVIANRISAVSQQDVEKVVTYRNALAYLRPELCSQATAEESFMTAYTEFSELVNEDDHDSVREGEAGHSKFQLDELNKRGLPPSEVCLFSLSSRMYDVALCDGISSPDWKLFCLSRFEKVDCTSMTDESMEQTCMSNQQQI